MTIGQGDKATSLFKLATTLSVMIASTAASFGGVYKFRTKGWHSSNQLLGSLQHIKRLTFGVLRGPVFSLVVQPKQVHGGGVSSVAQVVRVDIRGNDLKQLRDDAMAGVKYELDNLKAVQLCERQYRLLMSTPSEVIDADADPVADALAIEGDDAARIAEKVAREARWLEAEFGTAVDCVSFHQPTRAILDGNLHVPGMVNTYNRNQMADYFYVSDTNMHWRHEHPLQIFEQAIYPRLQLLMHPMWWTGGPLDVRGKWMSVLAANRGHVVRHWKRRERTLEAIDLDDRGPAS
jgi:hypothetical protein